jgi:TPR repeat protein
MPHAHCQVRAAADAGDSAAQLQIAALLEKGQGPKQDLVAAAAYYQKAADQGCPAGMSGMGIMLRFGRGVKKDTAAAARLLRRLSSILLSCSYRFALHRRPSPPRLFAAAAEKGDAVAQVNLGDLHYYGAGVKKDWALTFKLCGRAVCAGCSAH